MLVDNVYSSRREIQINGTIIDLASAGVDLRSR